MKREIIKDTAFLSQVAEPATKKDIKTVDDLRDTLIANSDRCVGLAANMIGVNKAIIVYYDYDLNLVGEMFNPVILNKKSPFQGKEGCLSLDRTTEVTRYRRIIVQYEDRNFEEHVHSFHDNTAQVIQHEIDHCNGILV